MKKKLIFLLLLISAVQFFQIGIKEVVIEAAEIRLPWGEGKFPNFEKFKTTIQQTANRSYATEILNKKIEQATGELGWAVGSQEVVEIVVPTYALVSPPTEYDWLWISWIASDKTTMQIPQYSQVYFGPSPLFKNQYPGVFLVGDIKATSPSNDISLSTNQEINLALDRMTIRVTITRLKESDVKNYPIQLDVSNLQLSTTAYAPGRDQYIFYPRVMPENVTVETAANFTVKTAEHEKRSLKVNVSGRGTASAENTDILIGHSTSIKAKPAENARFVEWIIDNQSGVTTPSEIADPKSLNTTFKMGSSDTTITAKFEDIQLTASAKPQELYLGEVLDSNQLKDFVQNVMYNGEELTASQYKVTLKEPLDTSLVIESEVMTSVEHIKSGTTIEVPVKVAVKYGHTLLSRNSQSENNTSFLSSSTAALSLLTNNEPPILVATRGYGNFNSNLGSRPTFTIYRENETDQITNLPYGTVARNRESVVSEWNDILSKSTPEYGDVIKVNIRTSNSSAEYMGHNTWVSRNEELILESEGYKDAYYMLTKKGYHLLRVNQLVNAKETVSVPLNVTKEELNRRAANFLDFPEFFTDEEKTQFKFEFVSDALTDTSGLKKGTVKVTQVLDNVGNFSLDYEISYQVEPGNLEIESLNNLDFDFGSVKATSSKKRIAGIGESLPEIVISDYSDATTWSLQVSQPEPFKDVNNRELKGAYLTFSDFKIDSVHEQMQVPSSEVIIEQSPVSIAEMINSEGRIENGKTTIGIGTVQTGKLSGVTLHIPRNTILEESTYSTTLCWELIGDPTLKQQSSKS
ncbi:WxL domain-containing protein [Enterococcus mundtii]|uniref:WxL domain-containing protein n=1 Tax=Enterococcus mundtii TaxID=53346 RepID=A0A242KUZ2_ENTMU|nr:WxL domain-containing protein [Enterococcus mundtii]OTP24858.1 hypothetical protein A5802_003013 [Enterococcus mundtii]